MRYLLLSLALLTGPALAGAQTCSASPCAATAITAKLTVKSAVTFTPAANIDFGIVAPGLSGSADAQGAATPSGGSPGSVILTANQAVTVTASFSNLTAAGLPALPVTSPACGMSTTTTSSAANTTLFTCSTGQATAAGGSGATGVHIWLGGTVATTASTAAGSYAGTATVTGTYTVY